MDRGFNFWTIQVPGWLLLLYLVYAQAIPAIDYEHGVAMGTQEPAEIVSEVGVAFWYGFALGDLLVYIPLLAIGLIGHGASRHWGRMVLAAALGITVYWPVVCLAALTRARGAEGWHLSDERAYWVVLPVITIWAAWAFLRLLSSKS